MRTVLLFLAATFLAFCLGLDVAKPEVSVKMIGDSDADLFVCCRLEPGELTCLDSETYAKKLEARQRREDM